MIRQLRVVQRFGARDESAVGPPQFIKLRRCAAIGTLEKIIRKFELNSILALFRQRHDGERLRPEAGVKLGQQGDAGEKINRRAAEYQQQPEAGEDGQRELPPDGFHAGSLSV